MTRLVALVLALFGVSLLGTLGGDPAGRVYASQTGSVGQSPYAQTGDSAAGKEFWNGYECAHCHGLYGQGGYGPDLAGLGLTFEQFKHQVRQPWGAMLRWSDKQISDKQLTDIYAFLTSLPRVATPGVAPPGVPHRHQQSPSWREQHRQAFSCHRTAQCAIGTEVRDQPGRLRAVPWARAAQLARGVGLQDKPPL